MSKLTNDQLFIPISDIISDIMFTNTQVPHLLHVESSAGLPDLDVQS